MPTSNYVQGEATFTASAIRAGKCLFLCFKMSTKQQFLSVIELNYYI